MSSTPILNGVLQNDINFAGHRALNANFTAIPGVAINVKDAPYNAVGDGVANDATAINTALGALNTAGGGTLFFPRGIYLCNGLNAPYNAVLQLPLIDATTTSAVAIRILGETTPPWSVATAFTEARNSTIKTTQAGSGSFPALLAGSVGRAPGVIPYTSMNNLMVSIENMSFIVPDNPSIHGVRLDGVGWSMLENVRVFAGNAGTEPLTATCGLWLPASQNFSINTADRVSVAGFNTDVRTGEHLRATMLQVMNSKVGVEFTDGIYPSWANIQAINCVDALKWSGQHPVVVMLETEHAPSGWMAAVHEIKDPSNFGTGLVRYFIGQGGRPNPSIAASLDGGTHLVLTNLGTGL